VGYGGLVKGFDIVIRLFYKLKSEYNLKLILAGTLGHNFEYYPEITLESYENADFPVWIEKLNKDPDVIFRSFKRKELFTSVYPKADIYLHLSRLETFGYSILEAMSFGLPVVATRLHAIPEMVSDNINGVLVDGFQYDINSDEWIGETLMQAENAVRKLIDDPDLRKTYGENSKNLIREKFNMEEKRRLLVSCYWDNLT
jgi:glycosyltransferase involved in cell wall biosynthesis